MRFRRLVLSAVGAVGLVGLASLPAGAATSAQQNKFAKDVRFLDPDASGVSNKTIFKLGNSVCKDLKSGTSVKSLAKVLKGSEKGVLVAASTDLCSKYQAKVATYYASTTTTTTGPTYTQQQKSAIQAAKQYLQSEAFSQQGLIDQLDSSAGDGYSVSDATVAVDSLTTVNWNAEAEQAAKAYMQSEPFSCADLIQQLDSSAGDQYTVAQATYGAQQAGDCG